jgi:hypothetical protein
MSAAPTISEVLPKAGLVYSEKGNLSEVLSKPKVLPARHCLPRPSTPCQPSFLDSQANL